jgi:ATP-dependent helicase YprA (DUF1998 family)
MPSSSEDQSNVLQAARDAAASSRQYSSDKTREDLCLAFKKAFNGLKPYDWQLDVTEAILLGLDCAAIAGTGSGKTMPFLMPLLVDKTKKKMVIVISPLNDLEEDQVSILYFFCERSSTIDITLGSQVERYRFNGDSCEW